jgi:hypothetical protein
MDWNERAETAEQARIDDYDRDRLLSLSESVAHEIAMDVARCNGVEWSHYRADFYECLAKSVDDTALKSRYSLIASVYRNGASQVERTRRAS